MVRAINLINVFESAVVSVFLLGKRSTVSVRLNSCLAQEKVVSSLLFILYLSDFPQTILQKSIFAKDLAMALQYGCNGPTDTFAITALNKELKKLASYYVCMLETTITKQQNRKSKRHFEFPFIKSNSKSYN